MIVEHSIEVGRIGQLPRILYIGNEVSKMLAVVCINKRVETLKRLETYSYQVAYYVLQDEGLAIEATITALLELSMVDDFYMKPLPVQLDITKKTTIKNSIAVRQKNFRIIE
ncbi:hypothetical protein [Paenibacillus sedimenti]|uniref:Uncharacterized protein n=1 Tax=Paenibacillus sedimenti TaxID=2770274 RepID=A0A926QN06_9BACL|nr:hypothetical protein [Paenibacillus sedimenti]MBD0384478.1 hypothetical protein [Paenibacillus sedimenti]